MADLGENIKEVEFEPIPVDTPVQEPSPIVVPEPAPEKVPA